MQSDRGTESKGQGGTQRERQMEAERGRQPSGKTPKPRSSPVSGRAEAPAHRKPRSPAAGGRKLPGWKGRAAPPPSVTRSRRVASAPQLSGVAEKAGWRAGGGTKFRAWRSSLRTCSGRRARSEVRGGRLAMSAGAPAPGPARDAGLCTLPLAAGLCGAHPCTPAIKRGLAPDNYEEEKRDKRERERRRPAIVPKDPAKREGRSTHGIQPLTQPGRCWPAAPSAWRAEPALTWNPRRPASAARSRAPSRASLFTLPREQTEPAPAWASPREAPS